MTCLNVFGPIVFIFLKELISHWEPNVRTAKSVKVCDFYVGFYAGKLSLQWKLMKLRVQMDSFCINPLRDTRGPNQWTRQKAAQKHAFQYYCLSPLCRVNNHNYCHLMQLQKKNSKTCKDFFLCRKFSKIQCLVPCFFLSIILLLLLHVTPELSVFLFSYSISLTQFPVDQQRDSDSDPSPPLSYFLLIVYNSF